MLWLLNILYSVALLALSPVIAWRMLRHGRYRRGITEKLLGRLPIIDGSRPVVWFHAVSVGEVLQLQRVVADFRRHTTGECHVVVSTSTDTGYDLAIERFSDCTVTWFPLDFSWAVSAALERVRPALVVLTELELWPGFLTACRRRGVRTAIINARMSDRSFAGYQRLSPLVRPIMRNFDLIAAQSEEYAQRLAELGTRPDVTTVSGSIKFDRVETDPGNAATEQLRQLFGIRPTDRVLIAGSTQDPEEAMAVEAWHSLRTDCTDLRLILVPRHRERFDAVAELVESRGLRCLRRSTMQADEVVGDVDAVILLDTIGELGACWGLAEIAFVGGTFGNRGGQNMLEPAAYGAAVTFGPNTWNFKDIVARLLTANAAIQLPNMDSFESVVADLLSDESRRRQLGQSAQAMIREQQGAVDRTVQLLLNVSELAQVARKRTAA